MCSYDFVLESEVKKVHNLFVLTTFICEEVLNCINIVGVPLKLKSCWISLWSSELNLILLSEHTAIEKIVNSLIVDLHETYINCDLSSGFCSDSLNFL